MTNDLFQHAKQKVHRARLHVDELEKKIGEFLAKQPYVNLYSDRVTEGGLQLNFTTYTREIIPASMPCIFGDAIHNLRVALDVAANDLVSLNCPPNRVYFPFGTDEASFELQMKKKMKGASELAMELVRRLRPWSNGNDTLRALHDLDIVDKHRAPLSTDTTHTSAPIRLREDRTLDISALNLVPIDQTLFREPYVPNEGFRLLGMTTAEHTIVISKDLPMAGTPVIGALNKLAQMVEGAIETFSTALG